jgi:putative spermidine/putrescine transport system ATP-binding protein
VTHSVGTDGHHPGTAGGSLVLNGVTKKYGDRRAVDQVSMEIAAGEFVTLLGPSGSGKTTTLNIIAGFAEADEGGVLLEGRELTGVPPHKRGVGMVFQSYALFPHMTAGENIAFPLKMRRVGRAEIAEKVRAALAIVHLEEYASRYPQQLSGGQQQRIALARAIVFQPRLLLMDEPLGALDKKLREALQLEIKRIHRELGVTFVYVTHDQDEALVMSDRIAIYHEGRIEQIGSAEELYKNPSSLFVADFIGESSIFRGSFHLTPDGGELHWKGRELHVSKENCGHARLQSGAAAAVVVRPERTRIRRVADESDEATADNRLPGVLREVIYLGAIRKYLIELTGGAVAQARVSAAEEDGHELAIGDRVFLEWPASASYLLPVGETRADDPAALVLDAA